MNLNGDDKLTLISSSNLIIIFLKRNLKFEFSFNKISRSTINFLIQVILNQKNKNNSLEFNG